jgi:hypothetical protein
MASFSTGAQRLDQNPLCSARHSQSARFCGVHQLGSTLLFVSFLRLCSVSSSWVLLSDDDDDDGDDAEAVDEEGDEEEEEGGGGEGDEGEEEVSAKSRKS